MTHRPYGRPAVDESDIDAVVDVLRSGWLTTGPKAPEFEAALEARFDGAEAVVCNSGTAALHMAYYGLGIGEDDIVLVPSMTFLATANAARYLGAEVVFCDNDPETGLVTSDNLRIAYESVPPEKRSRIKAAAVVHLNGQCVDMAGVAAFARARGLALVEDACHALGAMQDGPDGLVPVGSCHYSDACVFSFHAVKTVTTGEGGAVSTRNPAMAAKMRGFRNHGMVRDPALFEDTAHGFDASGNSYPWYYEMPEPGWNYRLSDIGCALGISQLQRLDAMVAERARLHALYQDLLSHAGLLAELVPTRKYGRPAWHLAAVQIDFEGAGTTREAVMARLSEHGYGSQVHYIPVHTQPYYRKRYGVQRLPGAEAYYERVLSLPLFVGLTDEEVGEVCSILADILCAFGTMQDRTHATTIR